MSLNRSDAPGGLPFNDGKAPDALRTIGEVARALNIRQHVLRYWEEQFPMLRPVKRSGGRRYYRPQDVWLIAEIDRLVHCEGYTLRGARQALAAPDTRPPAASLPHAGPADACGDLRMVARLREVRGLLADALREA